MELVERTERKIDVRPAVERYYECNSCKQQRDLWMEPRW
jgi:hypothetical protein